MTPRLLARRRVFMAGVSLGLVWALWHVMVDFYANTRSLLLAVLMHASYTGWLLVLYPATSFQQGLIWQSAFAAALWLMVVVVMTRVVHRERVGSRLSCTIEVRRPA